MNFYTLSTGITALLSFSLGIFVYLHDKKRLLNKTWFHLSLSISLWSFGYFLTLTEYFSHDTTLLFSRLSHASGAFIPILFFEFVTVLLDCRPRYKKFLRYGYIFSSILFIFCFTPLVVKDVVLKLNIKFYPEWGILYPPYTWLYLIYAVYGNVILYRELKNSSGERRNQLRYFFIGTTLGFAGGISLFFLILNFRIPPFASVLIGIYPVITSYAIVKHRLMDIEVVIKKTLVFAGLFTTAYAIFAIFAFLGQAFFEDFIRWNRWLAVMPSIIIMVLALRPLENFLIRITDKYLFQKKYNPIQLIKSFADEILTLLDLDKLAKSTVLTLVKTLNLHSCAIALLNKDEDKYELQGSFGLHNKNMIINAESPFSNYLRRTNDILIYEENVPSDIKEDMKKLNAQLIIPLIIHKQIIGILALGKKKSDEDYTKEDIDILTTLVRTEAIAISNARLFTEAKQHVKLAAIGALSAGINHEVCNPLNRMMSAMQIFWKSVDLGLHKDKSEKELLQMSKAVMNDAMDDIRKIAGITKKLSDFAKPSRDATAEKISIGESLQETLGVLGHEIELKRIEFIKDAKDPLFIMADRDQIQEIFFNIIRNAIHAVSENGKIVFSAHKKGDRVLIDIIDSGSGIPEDKLQKIYDPFYTTKKEGKGTGLGLSIVRQLVTKNNGEILVKSQVGKGTTFTLNFPTEE
ncbi:MAG: GHKL domain-containing protein [Candidatus Omnitrophica bacterium]|nr:GHKL domain-containing protein [Candidatus Omnitrophota bacterium]